MMHVVDEFLFTWNLHCYDVWKLIRIVDVRTQKEKFHFVVQRNPEVEGI